MAAWQAAQAARAARADPGEKKQGHMAPVPCAPDAAQRFTGLAAISSRRRALMT